MSDTLTARRGRVQTAERRERPRRGGPALWLGTALAGLVVVVLGAAVLRPAVDDPLIRYNTPAGAFTLTTYDGRHLSLASLRGHTVVVNFWYAACDPCKQEAAVLERAWQTWRARGVVFLGVDTQDDTATARRFLRTYGVTYPNAPDPGTLSIDYGTTGTPETVFITPRSLKHDKYALPFADTATLDRLIREAQV